MKTALFAFLVSFGAYAETCFVRNVELVRSEVTLAKEVCFTNIEMKLDLFRDSKAIVSYKLDGVEKQKEIKIYNPIERRDGKVAVLAWLESNSDGGWCSDTVEAQSMAMLVVNRDGSNPYVEYLEGSVGETNDNCHSSMREIQSFKYEAR